MTVSQSFLIRAAGAAAVAAGAIFVGVNINHPHLDIDSIATTELAIRNTLKVLMCALAVIGITGMYLGQVRRNGVLGLVGYLGPERGLSPDHVHDLRRGVRAALSHRDRPFLRPGRSRRGPW